MSDQNPNDGDGPTVAYANHVDVGMTVYDLALTSGIGSDGQVAPHVRVHMSPQHAKSLYVLLGRFLLRYEEDVGPITLPEALVERLSGDLSTKTPDEDEDDVPN